MQVDSSRRWAIASIVSVVLLSTGVGPAAARGVSVAPTRIVLEGRTTTATVYVSNRNPTTATYRISLARLEMREDGAIVPVDSLSDSRSLWADDLIRFSPRRVALPPGGSQTIRILVRRPRGDMPQNAEYRAHLSIQAIPEVPHLSDLEDKPKQSEPRSDSVSIKAIATVETLIPIIVRFGRLDADVQLSAVELEPYTSGGAATCSVWIERSGDRSVYGDLRVFHVDPKGHRTQLGFAHGVAVYTPLERRSHRQPLEVPDFVDLDRGNLVVEFEETGIESGARSSQLQVPLPMGRTD